jgi:hypothetical protein
LDLTQARDASGFYSIIALGPVPAFLQPFMDATLWDFGIHGENEGKSHCKSMIYHGRQRTAQFGIHGTSTGQEDSLKGSPADA